MGDLSEGPQGTKPGHAATGTPGAGVWLLLAGIAVSCTGVGAIVGVPLIVFGLAMPRARRHRSARRLASAPREVGAAAAPLSPSHR